MNAYIPVMIFNVLKSLRLLADAMTSFRLHLLDGLRADHDRIRGHVNRSLMLVTALNPVIGYEKAAEIALFAHRSGKTLKEAALELGHVTEEEFDRIVIPEKMVSPRD
jgi:fumarate hydratase class II